MKKVVVTSAFLIGGLYLLNKLLGVLKNNTDSLQTNSNEFEVPEFIISKGSVGLPKYEAPDEVEIYNMDMYEPDRNRQGETIAGDSKNMCRQYGTCPPSLNKELGMW